MQTKDIKKKLSKILPYLLEAKSASLNEADTSQRICSVFVDVLGYDPYRDISKEATLREKRADVVLKVNGKARIVVEIKAGAEKLRSAHIEQAKGYGANNGIPWVVLTNGINWHLFHLTFSKKGIEEVLTFAINVEDANSLDEACERLALLHHSAVENDELDYFWAQAKALNAISLAKVIFTEETMMVLRRELRHQHNLLIDVDQIAQTLWKMIDRNVQIEIGPMHLRKKEKYRKTRRCGDVWRGRNSWFQHGRCATAR